MRAKSRKPSQQQRPGVDEYGRTPLHYAAADRQLEEVQRLLASGADPNARDNRRFTPLHFATQSGSVEISRVLLEAGTEVDAQDDYGNTPLSNAIYHGHNLELLQLLLDAGADPDAPNHYGVSPAGLAFDATADDPQIAQFFVDACELLRKRRRKRRSES